MIMLVVISLVFIIEGFIMFMISKEWVILLRLKLGWKFVIDILLIKCKV